MKRILAATLTAFALSACIPVPEPEVYVDPAQPTVPAASPSPGACDHPFWPLRPDARWEFNGLTISAAETNDGVTLSTGEDRADLKCADMLIRGLLPGTLAPGHPDLGPRLTAEVISGALLTSEVDRPGAVWDQELAVSGEIFLPIDGEADFYAVRDGRMVLFHQVTQQRAPVNVPAGSFDALIVRQDVFYQISVGTGIGSQQEVIISTVVEWAFAEEVGPVRISYQGGTISTASGAWNLTPGPAYDLLSVSFP